MPEPTKSVNLLQDIHTLTAIATLLPDLLSSTDLMTQRNLLAQLGHLANLISHNENDENCIRNKLGTLSDLRTDKRENRYRPTGIPFIELAHIGLIAPQPAPLNDELFSAWLKLIKTPLESLNTAIAHILHMYAESGPIPHAAELKLDCSVLISFGQYAQDHLLLKTILTSFEDFSATDLNMANQLDRYAVARFYSILGEAAKSFSPAFTQHPHLGPLFHSLGKLRDEFKKPQFVVSSAQRTQAFFSVLKHFHAPAMIFFNALQVSLKQYTLTHTAEPFNEYALYCRQSIDAYLAKGLVETQIKDIQAELTLAFEENNKIRKTPKAEASKPIATASRESSPKSEPLKLIQQYAKAYQKRVGAQNRWEKDKTNPHFLKAITEGGIELEKTLSLYASSYESYAEHGELPEPNQEAILSYHSLTVSAEKPPTVPKAVLESYDNLNDTLKLIENESRLLWDIKMTGKLDVKTLRAREQAFAFLGQLQRDLAEELKKMGNPVAAPSLWQRDQHKTISIRNGGVSHNLPFYNPDIVDEHIEKGVLYWHGHIKDMSLVLTFQRDHLLKNMAQISDAVIAANANPQQAGFQLNRMGLAYQRLGQLEQAMNYYQAALKLLVDENHQACCLHNIAEIYRDQNNWQQAERYMGQVMAIRRRILPESDPHYTSTLNNLALCQAKNGHYDAAISSFTEVLAIAKKHPDILKPTMSHKHLGDLYADRGDYTLSNKHYAAACEDELPLIEYVYLLHSISIKLLECGQYHQALDYNQRALTTLHSNEGYFKSQLADNFISFKASFYAGIAESHLQLGEPKRSIEILSPLEKEGDPRLKVQYAKILAMVGRAEEAITSFKLILAALRSLTPEDPHLTIEILNLLGFALIQAHKFEEAEAYLHQGLKLLSEMDTEKNCLQAVMKISLFNNLSLLAIKRKASPEALLYSHQAFALVEAASMPSLGSEAAHALLNYLCVNLTHGDAALALAANTKYQAHIAHGLQEAPIKFADFILHLISSFESRHPAEARVYITMLYTVYPKLTSDLKDRLANASLSLANTLSENNEHGLAIELMHTVMLHSKEKNKPLNSLFLAHIMTEVNDLGLCETVDLYAKSWLAISTDPDKVANHLRKISSLYHHCGILAADNGLKDKAVHYWQRAIALNVQTFNALGKMPLDDPSENLKILYQSQRQTPYAITEVLKVSKSTLQQLCHTWYSLLAAISHHPQNKPFEWIIEHKLMAELINTCFLASEATLSNTAKGGKTLVKITLPKAWNKYLTAYFAYFVSDFMHEAAKTSSEPTALASRLSRLFVSAGSGMPEVHDCPKTC